MKTTIKIPATSANLGAGFDIIGLSIDNLTDTLDVSWGTDAKTDQKVQVIGGGLFSELGDLSFETTENMVYRLIFDELSRLKSQYCAEIAQIPNIEASFNFSIVCHNNIAHSRGLGSSSAAIVSALRATYRIWTDVTAITPDNLDESAWVFQRGCEIEGHPDNVAPCVYTGIQLAYLQGGTYHLTDIKPSTELNIALQVFRNTSLKTDDARKVIPSQIPHTDAIKNTRSLTLFALGLVKADNELLLNNVDYLHQEYRRNLYPQSMNLVDLGMKNGIPTYISGAGTTVISLWFGDELTKKYAQVFAQSTPSQDYSNIFIAD